MVELPDNPELLLSLMRNNTCALRYEAAIKLAQLAALDVVLIRRVFDSLRDCDGLYRESLYISVSNVDPNLNADVEDELLHRFRSSDDEVSRLAACALIKHETYVAPAVTRLLEDLGNVDPSIRRIAAGVLSQAPSQARRSVPKLVQLLADPHKDVRFAASRSLSILADSRIIPLFADLIEVKGTVPMIGWFIGFTIGRMPHIQSSALIWVESLHHSKPDLADSIATGITAGLAA